MSVSIAFPGDTLVELVLHRAQVQGDAIAYTFLADGEDDAQTMTYGQLERRSRALGAALQQRNMCGKPVLLQLESGLDYLIAFFGCQMSGAIAVPSYPHKSRRTWPRLMAIAQDSGATLALTTADDLAEMQSRLTDIPGVGELNWIAVDAIDEAAAEQWTPPSVDPQSPCFLQYTSGSTSSPKGVVVTHRSLLYNEKMVEAAFETDAMSRFASWLPPFHDMGLIGALLHPLYLGSGCVFMKPEHFLRNPLRWLSAISKHRARVSGGPNFAFDLCVDKIAEDAIADLDLSCWEVCYNGAEPIRASTLERFAERFAKCGFREEAIYPCYGLAEASLFVTGGEARSKPVVRRFDMAELGRGKAVAVNGKAEQYTQIVGCGNSWLDQDVKIVDADSRTYCGEGAIGEIWVAGSNVCAGYWRNDEATDATFRAKLNSGGDNRGHWMRTGDLGFVLEGDLFIAGRVKDVMIIRGQNYYPQDLELTAAKSHAFFDDNGTAAFVAPVDRNERLVIVQEVQRDKRRHIDAKEAVDAIRRTISIEHGLQAYAVVLCNLGSVPKTSSGKVQRRACREAWLAGQLKFLREDRLHLAPSDHPWSLSRDALHDVEPDRQLAVLDALLCVEISRILGVAVDECPLDESLNVFGFDEPSLEELIERLRSELHVEIGKPTLLSGITVSQLAKIIVTNWAEHEPSKTNSTDAATSKSCALPTIEGHGDKKSGANSTLDIAKTEIGSDLKHADAGGSAQRADHAIAWLCDFTQRRLNMLVADERRTLAPHVILGLGANGFMGLQAPEDAGGLSLTNFDTMRVLEQLAATDLSLASVVGVHNGLGLRPILSFATPELKSEVLSSLASGRTLGSFALTEPGCGSNPLAIQSSAAPSGRGWRLTAHKQWIGLAQWAGTINVFARRLDENGRAAGMIGIVVPENHPQLRNGRESLTMGLRAIIQNDVFVDDGYFDPKYVLGVPGEGFKVAQHAMKFCHLGIAAESIGVMKRCFHLMLTYASRRNISTGRLLDNPVTINRLEDILLAVGAVESLVYGIAEQLDQGVELPIEAYSACKILAPELAWSAADRLMQCLGGRGYIETNIAPRILRDTRILRIFEGPTETLQMHMGSRVVQQFDAVRVLLEKSPKGDELADRLEQDTRDFVKQSGASIADRHWLFQQVGQLASWAVLASFASKMRRLSSFTGADIQQWVQNGYERTKVAVQRERSFRRSMRTTASSLAAAGEMIATGFGSILETLPSPGTRIDEYLAQNSSPERNSRSIDLRRNGAGYNRQPRSTVSNGVPPDGMRNTREIVGNIVLDWLRKEVDPQTARVDDDQQFGAMGVDSVAAVSLTAELEKAFGGKLPDGLLFQHQSIAELVRFFDDQVSAGEDVEIRLATTPEELDAVYRFRYTIYVEEMNRKQFYADHEKRQIVDPLDEHADVFAAWERDRVVGTVRINLLRRDPLNEYRKLYGITDLTEEELEASSISSRIMLAPHVRQSSVASKLAVAAYEHYCHYGIRYDYCDCNDPVLSFFERIGYRIIRRIRHPEYGDVNVMRLDLTDTAYLRSIGSPLLS